MGSSQIKKRKKICVVTGSRADYGLLYWLIRAIKEDKKLVLQLVGTGTHLSKYHGLFYKNILRDGFPMAERVNILLNGDTELHITKSIGVGCQKFADMFNRLKPDMVVVLGDRYEMFAAAIASYVARIPLAHIHGGETTEGAVDEAFRHSMTKMASLHFASTESYRRRIIQLGEDPKSVFCFGVPGNDNLARLNLLKKEELSSLLNMDLSGTLALVTYHPVTLERGNPENQIKNLLFSIKQFDMKVVFTQANADSHGRSINKLLQEFCHQDKKRYRFFHFLGQRNYLSCLKHFHVMIGNSSSGLIEAPFFRLPVVNIGDRQKGRVRAKNVIDVGYSKEEIVKGIKKAISKGFRRSLRNLNNPYKKGRLGTTSLRIKECLKAYYPGEEFLKKRFYNIP